MLHSLRRTLRNRVGRLLGHPEIYLRLDQLEDSAARARRSDEAIQDNLSALDDNISSMDSRLMRRVEQSMLETVLAARDHTDRSVAEQQAHALRLAAIHAETAITEAQRTLLRDVRSEIDAVRTALVEGMDASSAGVLDQVLPQLVLLRRRLDSFEARSSAAGSLVPPPAAHRAADHDVDQPARVVIDNELYAALEDRFRGATASVKHRQTEYLPLVAHSDGDDYPVIDLGCGRGEWLTVLAEAGIPALGIDSNRVFVDEARGEGLNVEFGNLLEYLRTAADHSARAITLFQVLEHLPFDVVTEVIKHSARVLRPGGVLIAEVPNAKNLRVGAGTFWIDPTHERPWYPDVLEFLAQMNGFSDVGGRYLNPALPPVDVDGLSPELAAVIDRLSDAVDGAQDYALVARV